MKKRMVFYMALMMTTVSILGGCSRGNTVKTSNEKGDVSENITCEDIAESGEQGTWTEEEPYNTEEYNAVEENRFLSVKTSPLSTFSVDVDTASYSNIRRMLREGYTPEEIPEGAVRIEEMLNYFSYDYEEPKGRESFHISISGTDCPWNKENGLIRIGLKTRAIDFSETPESNLVFLLDVSGSMEDADKLPLLKQAFSMLSENLGKKDRVSIVTYAGSQEVVLEGAHGNERGEILEALENLEAYGCTNGGEGLKTAYDLAEEYFIEGGNNRIIMATDGDLNVGFTSESDLEDFVEEKRETGVYLSVLGFGTGNLKDNKMETLADNGNGNYAYIDSMYEAKKVLVEELGSSLTTVAEDVKIQAEFNPSYIREYRLLGYEDRRMEAEDFEDDSKDAGEVGAGHSVTALYEVVWADGTGQENGLRYQENTAKEGMEDEFGIVKIRYKEPGKSKAKEMQEVFGTKNYQKDIQKSGILLEASVAEFGMLLRDSKDKGEASYNQILEMWEEQDYDGNQQIEDFLKLVQAASGEREAVE